jgi:hypothetical protein
MYEYANMGIAAKARSICNTNLPAAQSPAYSTRVKVSAQGRLYSSGLFPSLCLNLGGRMPYRALEFIANQSARLSTSLHPNSERVNGKNGIEFYEIMWVVAILCLPLRSHLERLPFP